MYAPAPALSRDDPGVCTRLTASGLTSLLHSVAALRVQEIEHGLWRWTAPHPDWLPASGETGGWVEEVGSVYAELPGAILLIDPVVPADAEDAARLWRALDRDVERLRRPVCVLVTVHWHRRASDEVLERYGALEGVVPDGATAIPLGDPIGETVYALPGYDALVPGDIVLGGDGIEGERADGLRVCPPGWYGRSAAERWWYGGVGLQSALARLAQEAPERVLVSHGAPLLSGGAQALRALAAGVSGRRAA
ncbi:MAG: hypothetical protein QOD37_1395 [Gaiellales bacterium]|nr:hypothetical protein [Gaiellales bacterium]